MLLLSQDTKHCREMASCNPQRLPLLFFLNTCQGLSDGGQGVVLFNLYVCVCVCDRCTLTCTGDTVGEGRWWGLATWQWRGNTGLMLRTFFGDLLQRNCVPSPVVGQVRVGGRVLLLHDESWEEAKLAGLALLRLLRTAHCVFVSGCHVYWRWTSCIRLCVCVSEWMRERESVCVWERESPPLLCLALPPLQQLTGKRWRQHTRSMEKKQAQWGGPVSTQCIHGQ